MFLTVSHANSTLRCDNLSYYFTNVLVASPPVQWVSVYRSLQPRYQFKTWSKSIMGTDRLRGLALAYVHNITPEPLQRLQKWDTSGHRRISLAFSK